MRFFSSSALASAPKLRFAASCSAAETMLWLSPAAPHASSPKGCRQTPDIIWCSDSISPSFYRRIARDRRAMTQMLRRLAFVLPGRSQDLHRAAGLLDRSDRGFRGAVNLNGEPGLEFAAAEQPHAILGAAHNLGFHQRFDVDGATGIDQLGIDRLLQPVEIDLGEIELEDVGEAALRQAPMQRHLAALETLDAHARTRGLALAAAAGLLALARTDATADAHALFARAGIVGDIAELHRPVSLFLLLLADDADEMLNFCDHLANRRGILQL